MVKTLDVKARSEFESPTPREKPGMATHASNPAVGEEERKIPEAQQQAGVGKQQGSVQGAGSGVKNNCSSLAAPAEDPNLVLNTLSGEQITKAPGDLASLASTRGRISAFN